MAPEGVIVEVADIGDIPVNPYNLEAAVETIADAYAGIAAAGCRPLTLGGEHTIVWPIVRGLATRYGPIGVVHVDAHVGKVDRDLSGGVGIGVGQGAAGLGLDGDG